MTVKPVLEVLDWLWLKCKPQPWPVLVVEDNRDHAELLVQLIHECGRMVEVASTAEAAEALLKRNGRRYPIVFLDMRLPMLDGWDFVPHIWKFHPDTVVVVLSTELSDLTKIPCVEGGWYISIPKRNLEVNTLKNLFTKLKV